VDRHPDRLSRVLDPLIPDTAGFLRIKLVQVIPGESGELVGFVGGPGLPVGLPVGMLAAEVVRLAGQAVVEGVAHLRMELEPAGFLGILDEAVVAEGVPGGVLVHVAHGRERGTGGGLVEAGRLGEPRGPEFHRRVVQRPEEPPGEFLEVTGP